MKIIKHTYKNKVKNGIKIIKNTEKNGVKQNKALKVIE